LLVGARRRRGIRCGRRGHVRGVGERRGKEEKREEGEKEKEGGPVWKGRRYLNRASEERKKKIAPWTLEGRVVRKGLGRKLGFWARVDTGFASWARVDGVKSVVVVSDEKAPKPLRRVGGSQGCRNARGKSNGPLSRIRLASGRRGLSVWNRQTVRRGVREMATR